MAGWSFESLLPCLRLADHDIPNHTSKTVYQRRWRNTNTYRALDHHLIYYQRAKGLSSHKIAPRRNILTWMVPPRTLFSSLWSIRTTQRCTNSRWYASRAIGKVGTINGTPSFFFSWCIGTSSSPPYPRCLCKSTTATTFTIQTLSSYWYIKSRTPPTEHDSRSKWKEFAIYMMCLHIMCLCISHVYFLATSLLHITKHII